MGNTGSLPIQQHPNKRGVYSKANIEGKNCRLGDYGVKKLFRLGYLIFFLIIKARSVLRQKFFLRRDWLRQLTRPGTSSKTKSIQNKVRIKTGFVRKYSFPVRRGFEELLL